MHNEPNIDELFEEFEDVSERLLDFLKFMNELLPGGIFQFYGDDGDKYPKDNLFPTLTAQQLQKILSAGEQLLAADADLTGQKSIYGIPLPELGGRLIFSLPEKSCRLDDDPFGYFLIRNTVHLALLKIGEQEQKIENEQLNRQIKVLNTEHGKLIGDNYRQYRIIQNKEKEYAAKLEREIARQTRELREANVELEKASKMKSEFLANMSHELRTPMNAIIGFTQLLAETELDNTQQDYAGTINNSAQSLLTLINDILDLSKIEAGKLDLEEASFNLPDTINTVADMFRIPSENKNVDLHCTIDSELPENYIGDSNRLRQVLINLVSNALKFTENGEVYIKVNMEKQGPQGPLVAFIVKDTGIGIPAERTEAIFEKFVQADGSTTRKFGGTGLGLAICTQLVTLMGGEVGVRSEVGVGSTFYFTLPMQVDRQVRDSEPAATETVATQEPCREPRRILIVEDNPINQKLAMIMITKQGHEAEVAADGLRALNKLAKGVYHLVLMDVQMPNMDGLTATRKIREIEQDSTERQKYKAFAERTGKLPVVGLTAHARKEDREKCLEAGMDDFLSKPIIKVNLLAVLKNLL